jgi:hypothetical protein
MSLRFAWKVKKTQPSFAEAEERASRLIWRMARVVVFGSFFLNFRIDGGFDSVDVCEAVGEVLVAFA